MTIQVTTATPSGVSRHRGQEQAWLSAGREHHAGALATDAHPPEPLPREHLARAALHARIALAEAVDAATLAVQRAQSVSTVLDEALIVLSDAGVRQLPEPIPTTGTRGTGPALTSREMEVLALVAEGLTNKAIANTLFISPNTVKTHIASLLNKHNAETRVQLAALAARQAPPGAARPPVDR